MSEITADDLFKTKEELEESLLTPKTIVIGQGSATSRKALEALLMTGALVSSLGVNAYGFNPLEQFMGRQQEEKPPKDPKHKKKRTRRANNHRGMKEVSE
jgi:hypothetical protein